MLERLELAPPPNVVRVVGTNGKGSVTAMIAAGLSAAGWRTGRFLSPHVEDFRERVAVDGRRVAAEAVVDLVAQGRELISERDDLEPAFFEWTLALALREFARQEVAWGVIEAGVGGVSDATQVLNGPALRLVVLTNVDADHLETLGPTVADIARDKAAACQSGVPLVTAARGETLAVVAEVAALRGAPLHVVSEPAGGETTRRANERLAAAALRLLGQPDAAIRAAMALPPLPGRGERFSVAGRHVLLDGAHDPAAAKRLLAETPAGYTLLFGALSRKQAQATLTVLAGSAASVVLTAAAEDEPPPAAPPDLSALIVTDPAEALEVAIARTPPGNTLLIAGSLYLAGRVRPLLEDLGKRRP